MRSARHSRRLVTLTSTGACARACVYRSLDVRAGAVCARSWGGSSTQFSVIIWNAATQDTDDVSVFTSQAADMASLILDYINAIMATTDTS